MSLDEGFEDFYNEFKEWTKKQILHRTYDICLENADKDKEIDRLNNIINTIEQFITNNSKDCDKEEYHAYMTIWNLLQALKEGE